MINNFIICIKKIIYQLFDSIICWFTSIPFLTEFLIFVMILIYIIVISSVYDLEKICKIFFWIRFFLLLLFLFNIISLIYYHTLEAGFFFENYLINDFSTLVFKTCLVFLIYIASKYWINFILIYIKAWNSIKELMLLFLGSSFFLILMLSSYDLMLVAVCLMGLSICFCGLIKMNNVIISQCGFAAMNYFFISAVSVGLIIFGSTRVFSICGSCHYKEIHNQILFLLTETETSIQFTSLKIGIICIFIGFSIKLAVAPFHFWAPKIYSVIPYELLFFATLPIKFSTSIIFMKIFKIAFSNYYSVINGKILFLNLMEDIRSIFIIAIICSMCIGAFRAYKEQNLRRFIAYSSINQMGFLLIAVLGMEFSIKSIEIFLFFLFSYIINLLLFFVILLYISTENFNKKAAKYIDTPIIYIKDLKNMFWIFRFLKDEFGYGIIAHLVSILFICVIFSLAGIPPFIGFYSKFYILLYAVQNEEWLIVFIAIITSILSAFYYLRFFKIIFFDRKVTKELGRASIIRKSNLAYDNVVDVTSDTWTSIKNHWLAPEKYRFYQFLLFIVILLFILFPIYEIYIFEFIRLVARNLML